MPRLPQLAQDAVKQATAAGGQVAAAAKAHRPLLQAFCVPCTFILGVIITGLCVVSASTARERLRVVDLAYKYSNQIALEVSLNISSKLSRLERIVTTLSNQIPLGHFNSTRPAADDLNEVYSQLAHICFPGSADRVQMCYYATEQNEAFVVHPQPGVPSRSLLTDVADRKTFLLPLDEANLWPKSKFDNFTYSRLDPDPFRVLEHPGILNARSASWLPLSAPEKNLLCVASHNSTLTNDKMVVVVVSLNAGDFLYDLLELSTTKENLGVVVTMPDDPESKNHTIIASSSNYQKLCPSFEQINFRCPAFYPLHYWLEVGNATSKKQGQVSMDPNSHIVRDLHISAHTVVSIAGGQSWHVVTIKPLTDITGDFYGDAAQLFGISVGIALAWFIVFMVCLVPCVIIPNVKSFLEDRALSAYDHQEDVKA
jgi:hypothetical protein